MSKHTYEITKLYERYEKALCSHDQSISYIRTISYFTYGSLEINT